MNLTTDDRLNIIDVINRHGHVCDANALDRLDEVYTPDLILDASELGRPALPSFDPARSLKAYIAAGKESAPGTTVGMHATNIIVGETADGAHVVSKGLTVDEPGVTSSFTYTDRLVRNDDGWRISHRRILPRHEPGRGAEPRFKEHE